MVNSENGSNHAEEAAAALPASPASTDGDDVISNTYPAPKPEVAIRPAETELELREMKDELKYLMEASWTRKADSIAADHKQQHEELRGLYNGAFDRIKRIESIIAALQISAPRSEKHNSWMKIKNPASRVLEERKMGKIENRCRRLHRNIRTWHGSCLNDGCR